MIAELKPYAEYKESGLPWLGHVPSHWEVRRLKSSVIRNDAGVWGSVFRDQGTIVLRSTEQMIDGRWRVQNPARLMLTGSQQKAAKLEVGDLVVTKSSGSSLHIGKTSLVTQEIAALGCCFSNFMQRLRLSSDVCPRFASLLLNSRTGREQFVYQSTTTTGLGNLNGTILGNCVFSFPPREEQVAIVRFLDWANGRLERAIRAKRKVIALLNEQKQVIIHRAVTRGLDPSVPLKPSGIPWLGDIPQHWEALQVRRVVSFVTSGSRGWATYYRDSGLIFLQSGNLGRAMELKLANVQYIQPPDGAEGERTRVRVNDVLVCVTGALTGNVAIVDRELPEAAFVNQHIALVRPKRNVVEPRFLAYVLHSVVGRRQFKTSEYGGTKQGLGLGDVKSVFIPVPSLEEQRRICRHLDGDVTRFKDGNNRLEREIELLREYRTRLVADVVTGKLDVREATARLPDEAPLDRTEEEVEVGDEVELDDEEAIA